MVVWALGSCSTDIGSLSDRSSDGLVLASVVGWVAVWSVVGTDVDSTYSNVFVSVVVGSGSLAAVANYGRSGIRRDVVGKGVSDLVSVRSFESTG